MLYNPVIIGFWQSQYCLSLESAARMSSEEDDTWPVGPMKALKCRESQYATQHYNQVSAAHHALPTRQREDVSFRLQV